MPEDGLGSQSDHFGRSVAFFLLFFCHPITVYGWWGRLLLFVSMLDRSFVIVLPLSLVFFLLYFLLDKVTNNRDSREQQNKRAIFSSVAFNSIRCQLDRQIYNESEKKILKQWYSLLWLMLLDRKMRNKSWHHRKHFMFMKDETNVN
jgi:hypothetical protein